MFANSIIQNLQLWERNFVDNLDQNLASQSRTANSELIWIHNTPLLLLPTLLRRKNNNANIGFSLHSPFPSTDIFRMFPYRIEVLKSLLTCDLISFHMFEYARNFYTGVTRMLDVK